MVGADVDQPLCDVFEVLNARHLWHQHSIGFGPGGGIEVLQPPFGVETVDAHDHLARPETAGLERVAHGEACRRLGLGHDRILQIEHDAIDRQRARLLDRPGI